MSQPELEQPQQPLEARLIRAAGQFPYPATPDLAGSVRRMAQPAPTGQPLSRLAWAVLVLIIVASVLLAVPPVRAAVLEVLRFGAVRIFLVEPTPAPTLPPPTASPAARPTATPRPTPTSLTSLLDLAGETTLAEVEAQVGFPIRLPTYPPDLGPPDQVFLQDFDGPLLVLVWLAPNQPDQVRLSLHQLGPGTFAGKGAPSLIVETSVNGKPALWLEGEHLLTLRNGNFGPRRLVDGQVLIWVEDEITYRLETDLMLEEAVRVAESVR
jgi:hypothetical protein